MYCDIVMECYSVTYSDEFRLYYTWQLSSGEGLRIQLVGVLQTHQGLCSTGGILLIWEVLAVCGYVGNEA